MDETMFDSAKPTLIPLTDVARLVARRESIESGLTMYEAQHSTAQHMQHAEVYARQLNELYDINIKLKEVGL